MTSRSFSAQHNPFGGALDPAWDDSNFLNSPAPSAAAPTSIPVLPTLALNPVGTIAISGAVASAAGSNITFNNSFGSGVTVPYENCILAAEQAIQSLWTAPTPITINLDFTGAAQGPTGTLASNSFYVVGVSYAALKSALASHENSIFAQEAVASLPASDPTGGVGFQLPEAYAQMLGLTNSNLADTITLNTSYGWSYGQDVINTIEHEISEGAMGRIGGLGDQNSFWSTMDLFRYNASGAPDYTDGRDGLTTHFSYNAGHTLSLLSFNNEFNSSGTKVNSGDTADFTQLDVFGTGSPGETNTLSQTDILIMDALGWEAIGAAPKNITNDFNGAGLSDLVWQNGTTFTVWQSTGNGFTSNVYVGSVAPGWTLAATADFNGDGMSDLLWFNGSTHQFTEWQSTGSGFTQNSFVGSVSPGWTIAGTGDFNGDGQTDLIWQNGTTFTEWQSTGNSFTPNVYVGSVSAGWTLVGTGDFAGNGMSGLIWQNGTTFTEWQSTGNSFTQNVYVGSVSSGWTLAGTGDFTGNGMDDLVWFNSSTHQFTIWDSTGSGFTQNSFVGSVSPGWTIAGIGDYNGDGMSDLLWYNSSTQQFTEWQSTGSGFTQNVYVGAVSSGWTLPGGANLSMAEAGQATAATASSAVSTVAAGGASPDNFNFKPGFGGDAVANGSSSNSLELDQFAASAHVNQLQAAFNEQQTAEPPGLVQAANGGQGSMIDANHDVFAQANVHALHANGFIFHP